MGETRSVRLTSLDGLRGLAAVVVLVHHSLLTIPSIAADEPQAGWIVHTPLHVIWAGNEAVYVFFILSGLVLTLPALRRRMVWRSYYPSRIVRLYVPVVASIALAVVLAMLVPREGMTGRSPWMESHASPLSVASVIRNATLISPDWLNSPLWSLRWEVVFSLLLPIYVALTVWARRWWWIVGAGALLLSAAGSFAGVAAVTYLPMFLIGGAIAVAIVDDRVTVGQRAWPFVITVCLLGITSSWWVVGDFLPQISVGLVIASAAGIVTAASAWTAGRRFLDRRALQWLGRISFSLYLVHEPIVVSIGLMMPKPEGWAVPIIAIPVSLGAAYMFFRAVEAPSHRLARRAANMLPPATATSPRR